MLQHNELVRKLLRDARDREQEAGRLLDRVMKLTEEAAPLRAKAAALVRDLAVASDSGFSVNEPE